MTGSHLPLERIFSTPALAGPTPGLARYAPDGRRIAWLRPSAEDAERLELWVHDLDSDSRFRAVNPAQLPDEAALSQEEKDRRERLRIFSTGITEFLWDSSGDALLFPISGRLYRQPIGDDAEPVALTPETMSVTHVRAAQNSGVIAFVHAQNLQARLPNGEIRALTDDGAGTVSYGLPDFIAAEEMHRFDGCFLSPQGRQVAVIRTDEATIPETHRYEIDADGFHVHAQRYPFAGGPNASVDLEIIDIETGTRTRLEWREHPEDYLARVHWISEAAGLLIERQDRSQQTLSLVHLTPDHEMRIVHRETSDTWVNLSDDLHLIDAESRILWTTEIDGPRRLVSVDLATGDVQPLTPAGLNVLRVVGVDHERREAWFESNAEHATRRQLHRCALDGESAPVRITDGAGCHHAVPAPDFASFLDRHESLAQPPSLTIRDRDGALLRTLVDNAPEQKAHPYHDWLEGHLPSTLGTLVAADGQTLHFRLTPPQNAGDGERHPVVICVYGGPGAQRVQDAWPPFVQQHFARRGWGVFELDNRGTANRGRHFEAPLHKAMGSIEIEDQIVGLDWLVAQDWVDAERVAIFGHSYGGYMSLMCLAQHPERFRAAVSVAPVTDWSLYDTHYTERYMGLPAEAPEAWQTGSVFHWLEGLEEADPGALLLMHGMSDDNVLFTHTTRLMSALQNRGVQFELMTYPGAKHGLAGRATNLHRFDVITRFLAQRFGEDS